jgi:hypothetical protein
MCNECGVWRPLSAVARSERLHPRVCKPFVSAAPHPLVRFIHVPRMPSAAAASRPGRAALPPAVRHPAHCAPSRIRSCALVAAARRGTAPPRNLCLQLLHAHGVDILHSARTRDSHSCDTQGMGPFINMQGTSCSARRAPKLTFSAAGAAAAAVATGAAAAAGAALAAESAAGAGPGASELEAGEPAAQAIWAAAARLASISGSTTRAMVSDIGPAAPAHAAPCDVNVTGCPEAWISMVPCEHGRPTRSPLMVSSSDSGLGVGRAASRSSFRPSSFSSVPFSSCDTL